MCELFSFSSTSLRSLCSNFFSLFQFCQVSFPLALFPIYILHPKVLSSSMLKFSCDFVGNLHHILPYMVVFRFLPGIGSTSGKYTANIF
ncbi:hypothetical protein AMTRI_Chr04g244910 [Amborella trichopoda]